VIAELERASLSIADRSYPLQPDMRVDADVQLEQRTAWEWLLEPLLEAWRR
jgi:multidrug efflux pump subunit AcrA (membrane-fusion protein)